MKETVVKFIQENEIEFNTIGSGLNGAYTVVCGYADHIGATKTDVRIAVQSFTGGTLTTESEKELNRVFDFARTYNYGKWWLKDEAKRTYKF